MYKGGGGGYLLARKGVDVRATDAADVEKDGRPYDVSIMLEWSASECPVVYAFTPTMLATPQVNKDSRRASRCRSGPKWCWSGRAVGKHAAALVDVAESLGGGQC